MEPDAHAVKDCQAVAVDTLAFGVRQVTAMRLHGASSSRHARQQGVSRNEGYTEGRRTATPAPQCAWRMTGSVWRRSVFSNKEEIANLTNGAIVTILLPLFSI
jgi:hypothetical protein